MKPAKAVAALEPVDELSSLVVELQSNPGLLQAASNAAGAAYERAKRTWPGPIVENAWRRLCADYSRLKSTLNPQQVVPSSEGWRVLAQMLQLARAGAIEIDRMASLPWQEKRRLDEQAKRDGATARAQAETQRAVAHGAPPAPFSPAAAVAALAAEGVALTITAGELRASPAGKLTPQQRSYLAAHKAAIVAHLSSAEVI